MPRKESAEITLGGEPYLIETPNLDQLWAITELQQTAAAAKTPRERFDATIEVICVFIGRKPSEIHATLPEIVDALPVVMRVSGLEEMRKRAEDAAKKAKAPARKA